MTLKKLAFTPESGNVDTYAQAMSILSYFCDPLLYNINIYSGKLCAVLLQIE